MPIKQRNKTKPYAKVFGQYVVADPRICHGKPTFRGTRIFVADVLDQVASGMDWDQIVQEWGGDVPKEAIAEAVQIARDVLLTYYPFVPTAVEPLSDPS